MVFQYNAEDSINRQSMNNVINNTINKWSLQCTVYSLVHSFFQHLLWAEITFLLE